MGNALEGSIKCSDSITSIIDFSARRYSICAGGHVWVDARGKGSENRQTGVYEMKIIVGLGNPGKEYENTRHNLGFITLDRLAEKHGIKINKIKHKALVGDGFIGGQKVLLVKPQTYMNLSGESVREVLAFYKVEPRDMVVIYDDLDIPTGTFRIRAKGSAGTHNGMKSIVYNIVSDDFPRIRIGIGEERKSDLVHFVLGGFKGESAEKTRQAVDTVVEAVECIMESGIDKAMNKFNVKTKTKKKAEKAKEAEDGRAEEKAGTAGNGETAGNAASEAGAGAGGEAGDPRAGAGGEAGDPRAGRAGEPAGTEEMAGAAGTGENDFNGSQPQVE